LGNLAIGEIVLLVILYPGENTFGDIEFGDFTTGDL